MYSPFGQTTRHSRVSYHMANQLRGRTLSKDQNSQRELDNSMQSTFGGWQNNQTVEDEGSHEVFIPRLHLANISNSNALEQYCNDIQSLQLTNSAQLTPKQILGVSGKMTEQEYFLQHSRELNLNKNKLRESDCLHNRTVERKGQKHIHLPNHRENLYMTQKNSPLRGQKQAQTSNNSADYASIVTELKRLNERLSADSSDESMSQRRITVSDEGKLANGEIYRLSDVYNHLKNNIEQQYKNSSQSKRQEDRDQQAEKIIAIQNQDYQGSALQPLARAHSPGTIKQYYENNLFTPSTEANTKRKQEVVQIWRNNALADSEQPYQFTLHQLKVHEQPKNHIFFRPKLPFTPPHNSSTISQMPSPNSQTVKGRTKNRFSKQQQQTITRETTKKATKLSSLKKRESQEAAQFKTARVVVGLRGRKSSLFSLPHICDGALSRRKLRPQQQENQTDSKISSHYNVKQYNSGEEMRQSAAETSESPKMMKNKGNITSFMQNLAQRVQERRKVALQQKSQESKHNKTATDAQTLPSVDQSRQRLLRQTAMHSLTISPVSTRKGSSLVKVPTPQRPAVCLSLTERPIMENNFENKIIVENSENVASPQFSTANEITSISQALEKSSPSKSLTRYDNKNNNNNSKIFEPKVKRSLDCIRQIIGNVVNQNKESAYIFSYKENIFAQRNSLYKSYLPGSEGGFQLATLKQRSHAFKMHSPTHLQMAFESNLLRLENNLLTRNNEFMQAKKIKK